MNFLIFFLVILNFETNANEGTVEIKNPIFTTKGVDGNPYEIKAEKGYQNKNYLDLFVIEAKLKTTDYGWIYLQADTGTFNQSSGEIELNSNIIVYTESDEKIFSDLAFVNTNDRIIILTNNVIYQDKKIEIRANKSIIDNEFSKIIYSGNVKSKIINKISNE